MHHSLLPASAEAGLGSWLVHQLRQPRNSHCMKKKATKSKKAPPRRTAKKPAPKKAAAAKRLTSSDDIRLTRKELVALSGINLNQLGDWSSKYGIPFDSDPISLSDVLHGVRRFLLTHGPKVDKLNEISLRKDEADIRVKEEAVTLARLKRLAYQKRLMPAVHVEELLLRIPPVMKRIAGVLRREYGNDCVELYNSMVDDIEIEAGKIIEELGKDLEDE